MSAAVRICPQCGSEYPTDIKFCPKDGSTLRVPPGAALIGSVIADRYHILKKLGEGGMGQVFLAEHVKMGRPSAIKIMTPGMMQDADADQPVQPRGREREPHHAPERRRDLRLR